MSPSVEKKDIGHTAHNVAGDIARAVDEPATQPVDGSGRTKGPPRPARTGYAKGGAGLTHQTVLAIGHGAYLSVAPMAKLRLVSRRFGENLRSGRAEPGAAPAALQVPALPPYALAAMRGGAALLGPRHGAVNMTGRHALLLANRGQFFRPPNVKPANDQRLNGLSPEYARRSRRSNINPWVARLSKPSQAGSDQNFAPGRASALGGSGLDVAVKNAIAFQSTRFDAGHLMGRTMPSVAPRPHGAGAAGYNMMGAGLDVSAPNAPLDRQGMAAATDFWARKNQAGKALDARPVQTAHAMETPRTDGAAMKQAIEEHFALAARLPPAGITGFDPRLSPAWAGMQLPG